MIKKGDYTFNPQYWDHVSSEAKDLISKLLCVDSKQRLTAAGIKDHPWMNPGGKHVSNELPSFTANLRAYNAKRKFRGAIMSVQVLNYLGGANKLLPAKAEAKAKAQAEGIVEDVVAAEAPAAPAATAAAAEPS